MAKHRGLFTDKTIERRIKEGRGFGERDKYLPWITIRDLSSLGRCSEISGWKTNSRVHQLLSDLETKYFYILEFTSEITDIREQFPLLDEDKSISETLQIAESIGVKYPTIPKIGTKNVQTTDFLITLNINGKTELKARTIKYSKDLSDRRVIEKFEIERIFWTNRGIDWKIVTEKDIDSAFSFNVEFIHNAYFLRGSNFDFEKIIYVEDALRKDLLSEPKNLSKLTEVIDMKLGLIPGDSLFCIKYLIANKYWLIDMLKPINTDKIFVVKEFKNLTTNKEVAI
ncbi:TnsA endonuclease N-terminal domain-containing protein [Candidatus Clostridium stratigraminis]|uniref:TnsA endonuclease N-terminal domain-containing protein n=1 Tax=Candidatus Clostridium stratigraminis TaxID=3381661 RepID=A0ABW8T7G2_9CLOT